MAPDTKILEELMAVYKKRPPETDGLGNLPASVFDFAAASKLNTKALTSEALSEGMRLLREAVHERLPALRVSEALPASDGELAGVPAAMGAHFAAFLRRPGL